MANWKIHSKIYPLLRKIFPANLYFKEECDAIAGLLSLIQETPKTALDIGTGTGDSLFLLNNVERRVLLDHSLSMLSKLKPRAADRRVIGNAEDLPVRAGHFDLISCIGLSEYVVSKENLLREVFQAVKSGGHALITFSPRSRHSRLRNLLGKRIYPFSESEAIDLIAAQGFYVARNSKTRLQIQYLLQKL